ncbi:unnamed protein product [Anisakis simplex]|uniref:2O16 (inferred by orthology to a C. elegans protein) n=1 Tax=Anisakis simplex TaxID=6269 RepID=A0A0M3JRB1_ANISI|nr:unnamed protein product [Anisakis simplex]
MNSALYRISNRFSQLSLTNGASYASILEQTTKKYISPIKYLNVTSSVERIVDSRPTTSAFYLPGCVTNAKIYTFPTASQKVITVPAPSLADLGKFDPVTDKAPVESPVISTHIYAAPRLLTIRRKKMKKHKRRKRYDRDFFKYAKYHREKKLRAEKAFRARMNELLTELNSFNAENYVKDVIHRAKQEWTSELAPSGRKLYPHWSTLMKIEELYGLEKSDYIDRKAGLADDEDKERIKQLKNDFRKQFVLNSDDEHK